MITQAVAPALNKSCGIGLIGVSLSSPFSRSAYAAPQPQPVSYTTTVASTHRVASPANEITTTADVATEVAAAPVFDSGDTAWMLVSSALVLFMTLPGLGLFYGGLVRQKNVLSILMICFTCACIMTLIWMGVGYSLAFTSGNDFIGGLDKAFLNGVTAMSPAVESIPEPLWAMFQGTFCIIAPALIIGAFAERMKFSAMLIYCILWTLTTYIPFAHMVWGGGYFEALGLLDFAGGIVVHLTAGSAALLACIMIGPRKGKIEGEPHNLPMVITGTSMLWVGWFGFNAGSAVAASGTAAMAMVATQISAAAAGTTWMLLDWISDGKPTTLGICCGAVAGLVAITPGAGFVSPMGALWTGLLAGVVCRFASTTMKKRLGYDDTLDVWGVHGMGGFLGNQTCAIFGATQFGGTEVVASVTRQFMVHLYASLFAIAWSCAATFVILKALDMTIGLRPTDEGEAAGLDETDFGEAGYLTGSV
ncbi:hypothetical protein CYMTET_13933 [Cymbomonas tetramitiformis]|uniref:Ammonium transporter n=1 Tax=Cymbomonas tetramitiformis TaxID=36881 RepID=A0AAE0LAW8_9CHLO|nr:hypothetical protein CYMTET_13933 [Cymbomonas tetramitiformis]